MRATHWPQTSTRALSQWETLMIPLPTSPQSEARIGLARRDDQRLRHPGLHRGEGSGGPAAIARLTGMGGGTQA
jgi:hypothetical protein